MGSLDLMASLCREARMKHVMMQVTDATRQMQDAILQR
jgi:hypothetical protein